MDHKTREKSDKISAMLLALACYYANDEIGSKDIVLLPYKNKLSIFLKYLQRLIMEYIGKNIIGIGM